MALRPPLIAGDTLNYTVVLAKYPASEGWVLKYRLVPLQAGGAVIELQAITSADGVTYNVRSLAGQSAGWTPGKYGFAAWVENAGGETYTVETGQQEVLANPRTSAVATDSRSLAQRTLDELHEARAAWVQSGQFMSRRYKIGDREREYTSPAELNIEIQYWEGKLAAEQNAARLSKGLPGRNRILTRFVRPR